MRSEHDNAFREGGQHAAGTTVLPTALWLETAHAVFNWYGAMLQLALGIGRIDGRGEAQGLSTPTPLLTFVEESKRNSAPPSTGGMSDGGEAQRDTAPPAPAPLTSPVKPSRVAALHLVPTAPVKLRPTRRKTAPRGKSKRRSKVSSIKRRHRRAA